MEEQGATTLRDVLAQRRRHHVPGRRRRRAGRRSAVDPRLQRPHRHVRRRRARLRRLLARLLQHGAGRSGQGPTSSLAGRGSTGGAINQVSKAPALTPIADSHALAPATPSYQRTTVDLNQPLERLPVPGTAIRVNAMWTDTDVPNRDRVECDALGRGAVDRLRHRHAHARDAQLLQAEAGQPARVRPAVGAGQHQSGTRGVRQRRAAGRSVELLRPGQRATTRTPTPIWRRSIVAHDFGRTTRGPQPDALGPERARLGDHRAALRRRQHQHGDQPSAAVARHDRRDPGEPDQPDDPVGDGHASAHAIAAGLEFSLGDARSTTRAPGRRRRPPISSTRIRTIRIRARSSAAAPAPTARPTSAAAYAFDTVSHRQPCGS